MNTHSNVIAILFCSVVLMGGNANAGVMGSKWTEDGDAGDSLLTVNVPSNTGRCDLP